MLLRIFLVNIALIASVSSTDLINILNLVRENYPSTKPINQTASIRAENALCAAQLIKYAAALQDLVIPPADGKIKYNWAHEMLDASSKIPSGLLTGNMLDNGNFDECINIDDGEGDVHGKLCAYALIIPLNLLFTPPKRQIQVGSPDYYAASLCIPNQCTPSQIREILLPGLPESMFSDAMCTTRDTYKELTGADWAFLIFLIVIFSAVIASTLYDLHLHKHNKKPVHLITLAFSVYTNSQKILKISDNPDQLLCLNGLRVMSILWIIAGHRFALTKVLPLRNKYEADGWVSNPWTEYVQGAPVAVDTFMFLTGTLMAIGFIKTQSKPKAKFNIILFYVHRYLRITPALAVVYFLNVSVMKHLASGPQWQTIMDTGIEKCTTYWWTFFLYIQTLVNPDEICLLHTWYLSLDFQIYLISPLVLIPLVKFKKFAKIMLYVLIALSVIPPIIICYQYDLLMYSAEYDHYYYYMPYNRFAPWLIGLLTGVVLTDYKDKKVHINRFVNVAMWTIVLAMMLSILYLVNMVAYDYERWASAFVTGLHRMFWAWGLMWIVFACLKGYGGIINMFLSLPIFQVFAKITYSMYLIHIPLLMIALMPHKTAMYWDDYEIVNKSMGDLVIVSTLAFCWTLLFESPMVIIEKIIFGGGGKPRAKRPEAVSAPPDASAPSEDAPTKAEEATLEEVKLEDTNRDVVNLEEVKSEPVKEADVSSTKSDV